jgi:hypothetical protein
VLEAGEEEEALLLRVVGADKNKREKKSKGAVGKKKDAKERVGAEEGPADAEEERADAKERVGAEDDVHAIKLYKNPHKEMSSFFFYNEPIDTLFFNARFPARGHLLSDQ